jgi:hypothetical protein
VLSSDLSLIDLLVAARDDVGAFTSDASFQASESFKL